MSFDRMAKSTRDALQNLFKLGKIQQKAIEKFNESLECTVVKHNSSLYCEECDWTASCHKIKVLHDEKRHCISQDEYVKVPGTKSYIRKQ